MFGKSRYRPVSDLTGLLIDVPGIPGGIPGEYPGIPGIREYPGIPKCWNFELDISIKV
jgi:hypothetical protein